MTMAATNKIQIYDTTLRDGCQSEDVSLTIEDKVEIARRLDDLGIDYIEGGWPGSNDRDAAFFIEVKKAHLKHSKIAGFGSTRRAGVKASQDRNLQLLLKADTPVATVVGKTWDLHVREALRIPLEENFDILSDTISFLKKHVDEVIFDAEHFFDGYYNNREYAMNCIRTVGEAGAFSSHPAASASSRSASMYSMAAKGRQSSTDRITIGIRTPNRSMSGSPRPGSGSARGVSTPPAPGRCRPNN